ncbi:MAG: FecR family protein [Tannerella sp.]|jgi:ferric-dicitrate binding protein FerR (iron transport regulator)|nr:FecR family protein [Tannerella sp.]
MEQKISHIDELILSSLSGHSDPDETGELKEWLDASPENREHFRAVREIWLASGVLDHASRFDKNRAAERFLARTGNDTNIHRKKGLPLVVRYLSYAAAVAALLLIVSHISYRQGGEEVKSHFADIVIEAPMGAKTKMHLPDGTLVWLNANSRITYSQGFGVSDRNVGLDGEGYFEVTGNAALPFFVKTEGLQVKVLGTRFNFSNYPDNEEAIVSLIEGKVQVKNLMNVGEEKNMAPDEKAFLNKKTGQMRILSHRTRPSSEWTNGYLCFDNELLPDIVKTLERSYNVKISIADKSLETARFYSDFSRQEQSIEDILRLLKSTNKLTYIIEGKNIILRERK